MDFFYEFKTLETRLQSFEDIIRELLKVIPDLRNRMNWLLEQAKNYSPKEDSE